MPKYFDASTGQELTDPEAIRAAHVAGTLEYEDAEQVVVRTPEGGRVAVSGDSAPDKISEFLAKGYTLETGAEADATARAFDARSSPVQGVAEGLAQGATLGGYGLVASQVAPEYGKDMLARRDALGGYAGIAEAVGGVIPALATGGAGLAARGAAALPAGQLARATASVGARAAAAAEARGASAAAAKVIGMAAEGALDGAIGNVGLELSEAALGDTEITAERLLASGGIGALLGGAGGAAIGSLTSRGAKAIASRYQPVPVGSAGEIAPGVAPRIVEELTDDVAKEAGAFKYVPDRVKDFIAESGERVAPGSRETIKEALNDPTFLDDVLKKDQVKLKYNESIQTGLQQSLDQVNTFKKIAAGEYKLENLKRTVTRGNGHIAAQEMDTALNGYRQKLSEMRQGGLLKEPDYARKMEAVDRAAQKAREAFTGRVDKAPRSADRAQQLVADAGGLEAAGNRLAADASNQIEGRLDATRAAFAGATPEEATAIATGRAPAKGNTEIGAKIARGSKKLPPVEITIHDTGNGAPRITVGDGRHRLFAAQEAGASEIRANVRLVTTKNGREVAKVLGSKVVPIKPTPSAVVSGVTDEAQGFAILEDLKRGFASDAKNYSRVRGGIGASEAGPQLKTAADQAQESLRQLLQREDLFGKAAANQRERNAILSKMLDSAQKFDNELIEQTGERLNAEDWYDKRSFISATKANTFLDSLNDPLKKRNVNLVRQHIQDKLELVRTELRNEEVPAAFLAEFKQVETQLANTLTTIDDATKRLGRIGAFETLEKAERENLGGGLIGGAMRTAGVGLGSLVAGPGGAIVGGSIADAAMGLTRPASMLRKAAQLSAVAGKTREVGDAVTSRTKTAVQNLIRRTPEIAASNRWQHATRASVRLFGPDRESARERAKSFEKRITDLQRDQSKLIRAVAYQTSEFADVAPQTVLGLQQKTAGAVNFLASKLPPPSGFPNLLQPQKNTDRMWTDANIDAMQRYAAAAFDPQSVIQDLEAGNLTPEAVETIKALYPTLYRDMQVAAAEVLQNAPGSLPHDAVIQLSILLGISGAPSLTPEFQQMFQQIRESQAQAQQQPADGAPSPQAAKMVNQSKQFTPSQADRLSGGLESR